eukprot:2861814-Alexandrium_andersonii.AAC.1
MLRGAEARRRLGGRPTPPAVLAEVATLAEADAPQLQPARQGPAGSGPAGWNFKQGSEASCVSPSSGPAGERPNGCA